MKFIESPDLTVLSSLLNSVVLGEQNVLNGRIEAYSCKSSHADKVLSRGLSEQLLESAASSVQLSVSPVEKVMLDMNMDKMKHVDGWNTQCPLGSLVDPHVRKLLARLIATLNLSFPDYDFSNASPKDFRPESVEFATETLRRLVVEPIESINPCSFGKLLKESLTRHIDWPHCEVYSYVPSIEESDDAATLWSLNYFFYNKKLKKIIFLTCWSCHAVAGVDELVDGSLSQ